ncbi:hypothetical protein [Arthrobacter sp. 4R501]|uniref:hypothetical protein n=1 Tax=Arthrobacter sp. 4R501 TaxID=2058886 RepID=UPI000CE5402A|nr:hypothetical protein [Arthrobacter sp. 4R501]
MLNASQSGAASLATISLEQAKATPSAQWIVTTENGKQWSLVNAAAAIALFRPGAPQWITTRACGRLC